MVSLQIISKIIASSDNSIVDDNMLTEDYFEGYKEEFNFIQEHIAKYGNVPDKATFLSNFPDIELVDVTETDKYLVDTIREEFLYYQSTPVIQQWAKLLQTDSNAASQYLMSEMQRLQPNYSIGGTDIISQAKDRYEQFVERKSHQKDWFFESGFKELDELTHGIQREEELVVIVARTNQGKSWIIAKICTHIWQTGFNVGYFSPEMSANSIGFRFDTLYNKFSNKGLMWGKDSIQETEYESYIEGIQHKDNKFIVATPLDFDRQVTVTKLKNWVKQFKLDIIAIDGITYLTDERAKRGDNKTTALTNISEDLMSLSMELKIPVLVVVQANRSAVADKENEGTPELDSIRDSDGIAYNASKVLAIRQKKDQVLEIGIKKQRFGPVGGKLNYTWDIDMGEFTYMPSENDPIESTRQSRESHTPTGSNSKPVKKDKEDVF